MSAIACRFYNNGTFRLYYLLDEGHHSALGGLGGHQWAQASTRDLIHWEHHPLAIPLTEDFEGSICTGSVFYNAGVYYGFYATRERNWTQHLNLATSRDGIHFEKVNESLSYPPDGYDPHHFRDPVVFQDQDTRLFHLLATARLQAHSIPSRGGCLAHLVSDDLLHWEYREPFIIPGFTDVPECPDYFRWNDWYYLLMSSHGVAHYRMSKQPLGPWLRPKVDTFDGPAARVMKTAPFTNDRRIGVAWIGSRTGNVDTGVFQFGGNAVFRELVQHGDGTLGTKFVSDILATDANASIDIGFPNESSFRSGQQIHLPCREGIAIAEWSNFPLNARIKLRVHPQSEATGFGLRLRADEFDSGYDLHVAPYEKIVRLNDQWIYGVEKLSTSFVLEIVLYNDIIDVCIDNRRTLIDRCIEHKGTYVYFYGQDSSVKFEVLEVEKIYLADDLKSM